MSKSSEQITRVQQLEEVERNIARALELAGLVMNEVAKDKPVSKNVEANTNQFTRCLEAVENNLMSQINYLMIISTTQSHTGSSYAAQKDCQLAQHKSEVLKQCLVDLDKSLKNPPCF